MSYGSGAYKGFNPKMVMATAVGECKNMQAHGVCDKLDPHQAQMAALVTIAAKNSQRPRQSSSTGDLDCKTGGRGGPGGGGGGKDTLLNHGKPNSKAPSSFVTTRPGGFASSTRKEKVFTFVILLKIMMHGKHQRIK